MLYTVKHRCVGYPNDKPAEYTIEANSPEEADSIFSDAHVDMNYFIVSITPNTACARLETGAANADSVSNPAVSSG